MHATLPHRLAFDISGLQKAIAAEHSVDSLQLRLGQTQWDALAQYLQPFDLASNQLLMEQGSKDRSIYLLESGILSVHFEDGKNRVRLAMVGPGSVVGEGAFFSHQPRTATVQASSECKLWSLSPMRYAELAHRNPTEALALVQALGGVLARRFANKLKRPAIT